MKFIKVKLRDAGTSFQDTDGGQFISGNHVAEVKETGMILEAIATGRLVVAKDSDVVTITYDPAKVEEIEKKEAAAKKTEKPKKEKEKEGNDGTGKPEPGSYAEKVAEAEAGIKAMPYNEILAKANSYEDGKDLKQATGKEKLVAFLLEKWKLENPEA